MVDEKDREAYEKGQKEREFIQKEPIPWIIGGGVNPEPSKPSEKEAYHKGLRNEPLDDDKDNNGGGCYLTTACVSARELPDNCLELMTLRNFREKVLMQTPIGRKALIEYSNIAPKIVDSIETRNDRKEIWQSVYKDINQAVRFVLNGNFNQAFDHYKKMTKNLQEKFL